MVGTVVFLCQRQTVELWVVLHHQKREQGLAFPHRSDICERQREELTLTVVLCVPFSCPPSLLYSGHKAIPSVPQIRAGPSIPLTLCCDTMTSQIQLSSATLQDRVPERCIVLCSSPRIINPVICGYMECFVPPASGSGLCYCFSLVISSQILLSARKQGDKLLPANQLSAFSAAPCEKVITRGAADDAELQLDPKLVMQGDIFQSCNISILPNYENVKLTSVS